MKQTETETNTQTRRHTETEAERERDRERDTHRERDRDRERKKKKSDAHELYRADLSLGLQSFPNTNCVVGDINTCLLYTSPSPRDRHASRMPSSA